MGRYRKVDVSMWGDSWFKQLSPIPPCGAGLWVYLLTAPESSVIPGLIPAGEAGLSEALGWSLKAFREAFGEVSEDGKAKADWKARLIWLPNALKFNKPVSPNVVLGWKKAWSELPECAMKSQAKDAIYAFLKDMGKGYAKAFDEVIAKDLGDYKSHQDQDQDQEQKLPPLPPSRGVSDNGFDELWALHPGEKGPKAEALQAYRKINPPLEAAEAMRRQIAHKAECDRRGIFCSSLPHLHRWIKKHRWQDEIPVLEAGPNYRTMAKCARCHDHHFTDEPCPVEGG